MFTKDIKSKIIAHFENIEKDVEIELKFFYNDNTKNDNSI